MSTLDVLFQICSVSAVQRLLLFGVKLVAASRCTVSSSLLSRRGGAAPHSDRSPPSPTGGTARGSFRPGMSEPSRGGSPGVGRPG